LTNNPSSGRGNGHMTSLNFGNVSEMVQDREILTIED